MWDLGTIVARNQKLAAEINPKPEQQPCAICTDANRPADKPAVVTTVKETVAA